MKIFISTVDRYLAFERHQRLLFECDFAIFENLLLMSRGPVDQPIDVRQQLLSSWSQRIFYVRRYFGINLPNDKSVVFELAERNGQHLG